MKRFDFIIWKIHFSPSVSCIKWEQKYAKIALIFVSYIMYITHSLLLTDLQQIYRNFIGQETKPGHIAILRQVMTNKKYHLFVN